MAPNIQHRIRWIRVKGSDRMIELNPPAKILGPVKISDLRIGDTLLSDIDGGVIEFSKAVPD